jgi:outer membrane protein assembly factor BamB
MKRTNNTTAAVVDKELTPGGKVHGVTFDGKLVWYASDEAIVAVDPATEKVTKRLAVKAPAGTAFDGTNLYQLAGDKILVVDPSDGRVVRELPSPRPRECSGLAYAAGPLFVGEYKDGRIHKVDAKTGEITKTLSSDRWVTGVSCVDGAIWHATGNNGAGAPQIRRLAEDGTVDEILEVSGVEYISGLESDRNGGFWCGGENGKLRHVRRGQGS